MKWNDKRSYSYANGYSVREWGWEFIRRDSRYQAEWESELQKYKKTPRTQVLMPYLLVPDLSQYSEGMISTSVNLIDPNDIDTFVIPADGAMKWGLRYYQNPESRKLNPANSFLIKLLHIGKSYEDEVLDTVTVAIEEHTLIVAIDLKKPIKTQIDEISNRAKYLQKQLQRNNPKIVTSKAEKISARDTNLWKTYLQCLDAEKSGVTRREAAPKIFGGAAQTPVQKWSETMKQIKKIAAKNYGQFMD